MPRVKALTTGSIPTFLDLVLNIAESDTSSSLATQDTWLAQMKAKNSGTITMWGDDTWLKLFPDFFDRADGTSSFFVSDFTEVDNNVTRHIPREMAKDDWSVMVMHYLGMDHIGHKSGPRSVNMLPKQTEMDGIAKTIFEAMQASPHLDSTLFVLCGDHGMNDGGNHGGSTPGETSPAMVFVSPKLQSINQKLQSPVSPESDFNYYEKIEQSDIAPTLSALLGFPVPLNNLGVMVQDFLGLWSDPADRVQLLLRNALQLLDIVKATFPHQLYDDIQQSYDCSKVDSTTEDLACAWREVAQGLPINPAQPYSAELLQKPLLDFSKKAQSKLSSTASNYDAPRLYFGLAISGLAIVLSSILIGSMSFPSLGSSTLWTVCVSVAYVVMMFASSYVEEEQQYWHWAAIAWALLPRGKMTSSSQIASLTAAVCVRLMRRWNQSGQKFSGASDIATDLLPRHPYVLLALNIVAFWISAESVSTKTLGTCKVPAVLARLIGYITAVSAFLFKLSFTYNDAPELFTLVSREYLQMFELLPSLVVLARVVFLLNALIFTYATYMHLTRSTSSSGNFQKPTLLGLSLPLITIILLLQTRAVNIPLFILLDILFRLFPALGVHSASQTALATLILGHASFFATGGTNAIGSVDLSLSYNGLSSYQPLLTATLCLISNYSTPFFCAAAGLVHLSQSYPTSQVTTGKPSGVVRLRQRTVTRAYYGHITFFMASMAFGVMAACTALRTHLFVWTVFSPKFLYAAAWFLGWHLLWNVGVLGTLALAG